MKKNLPPPFKSYLLAKRNEKLDKYETNIDRRRLVAKLKEIRESCKMKMQFCPPSLEASAHWAEHERKFGLK